MDKLRVENKYVFKSEDKFKLINQLIQQGYIQIYNKRIINSIYYDTKDLQCYIDTIEGNIPRKKFRIRSYNNREKDYKKEIKSVTEKGRFKTVTGLSTIPELIFDVSYKFLYPVVSISYSRNYFEKKGVRLTLDTDIIYKTILSNKEIRSDKLIVESKLADKTDYSESINNYRLFGMNNVSFSKYQEAIKLSKYFEI